MHPGGDFADRRQVGELGDAWSVAHPTALPDAGHEAVFCRHSPMRDRTVAARPDHLSRGDHERLRQRPVGGPELSHKVVREGRTPRKRRCRGPCSSRWKTRRTGGCAPNTSSSGALRQLADVVRQLVEAVLLIGGASGQLGDAQVRPGRQARPRQSAPRERRPHCPPATSVSASGSRPTR